MNQKLFDSEESQIKILSAIPDEGLRKAIEQDWRNSSSTPLEKWNDLKASVAVAVSYRI